MRVCKELCGLLAVPRQPVDAVQLASPWQGCLLTQLHHAPIRVLCSQEPRAAGPEALAGKGEATRGDGARTCSATLCGSAQL